MPCARTKEPICLVLLGAGKRRVTKTTGLADLAVSEAVPLCAGPRATSWRLRGQRATRAWLAVVEVHRGAQTARGRIEVIRMMPRARPPVVLRRAHAGAGARSHPPNHRGPLRRPASRRTKLPARRSRLASSSRASCATTSNRPAAAARDSAVAMALSTASSPLRGLGGSSGEPGGSSAVAKTSGCSPPLWGAGFRCFRDDGRRLGTTVRSGSTPPGDAKAILSEFPRGRRCRRCRSTPGRTSRVLPQTTGANKLVRTNRSEIVPSACTKIPSSTRPRKSLSRASSLVNREALPLL